MKVSYIDLFSNWWYWMYPAQKQQQLSMISIKSNTKHLINTITMTRLYNSDGSIVSDKKTDQSDESYQIIDAVLMQMSKLINVPSFMLMENGNILATYTEKPIQLTKDIYIKIDQIILNKTSIASVTLSLLSNTLSASQINEYVQKIHNNYIEELKNSLGNHIYFFDQKNRDNIPPPPMTNLHDEQMNYKRMLIATSSKQLSFNMMPFYSNKSFSNIYGSEIRKIEHRVKFFMNNKDWYDSKGIPYQLGIMLSGVPGSGKTSCIRAISKLTNRHIVNVNFANITTVSQLKNLFYSDKLQVYTDHTMSNMATYFIPIDQRLYILEEIDAIGNIVKQRSSRDFKETRPVLNDELTLMDILTILDGTMEIPGRIIVMTSNHPETLDKALIRPGRIDVLAYLGYADKKQIVEMYEGYMDKKFPEELFCDLPDNCITPAEVGQVLFKHFDKTIDNSADPVEIVRDLKEIAVKKDLRSTRS